MIYTQQMTITTKAGSKHNGSLLYTIRPIQEAIDLHNERQMDNLEERSQQQRAVKRLE